MGISRLVIRRGGPTRRKMRQLKLLTNCIHVMFVGPASGAQSPPQQLDAAPPDGPNEASPKLLERSNGAVRAPSVVRPSVSHARQSAWRAEERGRAANGRKFVLTGCVPRASTRVTMAIMNQSVSRPVSPEGWRQFRAKDARICVSEIFETKAQNLQLEVVWNCGKLVLERNQIRILRGMRAAHHFVTCSLAAQLPDRPPRSTGGASSTAARFAC